MVNQGARELVHEMVIDQDGLVNKDSDVLLFRYGVRGKEIKGKKMYMSSSGYKGYKLWKFSNRSYRAGLFKWGECSPTQWHTN